MNGFGAIAEFYDGLFSKDGKAWAAELVKTLKKHSPATVGIDVGSGTGYFTRALKSAGFSVVGVEPSPEMLNAAISIGGAEYVRGDMRRLKGFENLGFVTAVNDVINYIKPEDLNKAFTSVAACLQSGGVFVFDFSSEKRLKDIGGEMFGYDGEDMSYMWFNTVKNKGVLMELVFFVKNGSGLYERREDDFFEYFHDIKNVGKELEAAGFKYSVAGDGYRIKVVAEKI